MAFQLSPGVNVSEIDLTTVVPAVATTEGAIAGVFRWGPTDEAVLIGSENDLVIRFGKPFANTTWSNAETFFSAANFLAYSDALYVTRVVSDDAIKSSNTNFEAAYQGSLGNQLTVAWVNDSGFSATAVAEDINIQPSSTTGTIVVVGSAVSTHGVTVGDAIILSDGQEFLVTKIVDVTAAGDTTSTLTLDKKYIGTVAYSDDFEKQWGYSSRFDAAPTGSTGSNSFHVIVIDAGGITGTPQIIEKFENLSDTPSDKSYDGSTSYINAVLESRSQYIRVKSDATFAENNAVESLTLGTDGDDESAIALGKLALGYDLFKVSETIDVSLILGGKPNTTMSNYIIDNIVETRKDAIAFITPAVNAGSTTASALVSAVSTLSASSYAVVDSGYKYQYDKYNDVYRWIPLNGDVAGLCARTDEARDPWFSPAGYSRGAIKNVIKLGLNPSRADRDLLYKNSINPVITQAGQGTLLFGDKTFLSQPSAFDRINVRRLFIVLEKAISVAAKSTLFEFNDEFTRAQFKNLVEPYLRDVQGRRGIYDFRVVCDGTNNTGEVIDSNRFVGDIYIKPARAINFIQLNFIAVRTGVEFSEIVGQ
jgi:phage tail sheath protein FI